VRLSEQQYSEATALVNQGQSPADAVAQVAKNPQAAPVQTTAAAEPTPVQAPAAAPTKAKAPKRPKLTADEADEYLRLLDRGMSHQEAVDALMAERSLASKLGTMSPDTMRQRVARRLRSDNRTASEGPPETAVASPERTPVSDTPPAASVPAPPKVHKGVYYFDSFESARKYATDNSLPSDRIKNYGRGWAIQQRVSGPYVGPQTAATAAPVESTGKLAKVEDITGNLKLADDVAEARFGDREAYQTPASAKGELPAEPYVVNPEGDAAAIARVNQRATPETPVAKRRSPRDRRPVPKPEAPKPEAPPVAAKAAETPAPKAAPVQTHEPPKPGTPTKSWTNEQVKKRLEVVRYNINRHSLNRYGSMFQRYQKEEAGLLEEVARRKSRGQWEAPPVAATPATPKPAGEETYLVVRYGPRGQMYAGTVDNVGVDWVSKPDQARRLTRAEVARIAETSDINGSDIRVYRNGDYRDKVEWDEVRGRTGYDDVNEESIYDPAKAWKAGSSPTPAPPVSTPAPKAPEAKPYQYTAEDKAIVDAVNPPAVKPLTREEWLAQVGDPKATRAQAEALMTEAQQLYDTVKGQKYMADRKTPRKNVPPEARRVMDQVNALRAQAGKIKDRAYAQERMHEDPGSHMRPENTLAGSKNFTAEFGRDEARAAAAREQWQAQNVKPAETTVTKTAKKATTPAKAAEQVKAQVEKVIDLKGAKGAADVQKRVIAALHEELAAVKSANHPEPTLQVHGKTGYISYDGERVAEIDYKGRFQWSKDRVTYQPGHQPAKSESSNPLETHDGPFSRTYSMVTQEGKQAAINRVKFASENARNAGMVSVQIPGDGTFTIRRTPQALEEVVKRIQQGGQSTWRGLVAGEKPPPKPKPKTFPPDVFPDRPWTKWENYD
jgi:hypothetical protein